MEKESATVAFVIPGVAVGKGRPKFARRGNFVTAYTPERTASYENLVKLAAHRAMNGRQPFTEAVGCTIAIEVEPAPSWSNKKRIAALSGDLRPTGKPDLDNVAKGVLDAMNDIVFKDDKQVVILSVSKRYSEQSQATVEVITL
ncbi:MAG: RusA family crossover junction endodeoxyribonuclease [Sulfuricella sp.]